jgi:NADH dehydrogenase FAD-containing subunit
LFARIMAVAMDFEESSMSDLKISSKPRVVIVGGGFGGLSVATGLAGQSFEVTLIDRNNHHVFQPLLYQVATAGLSPADIASPIRNILSGQRNARVMLADVTGIDLKSREVRLSRARDRRTPRLFWPRRLGVLCARPEIAR